MYLLGQSNNIVESNYPLRQIRYTRIWDGNCYILRIHENLIVHWLNFWELQFPWISQFPWNVRILTPTFLVGNINYYKCVYVRITNVIYMCVYTHIHIYKRCPNLLWDYSIFCLPHRLIVWYMEFETFIFTDLQHIV